MAGGLQKKKREETGASPATLPGKKKKRKAKVPAIKKGY